MTDRQYGFIGLGQMGAPMAANIAKAGFPLLVYDKAGTAERAPEGCTVAESLAEVARAADTIFMSLPDGLVSLAVLGELAEMAERRAQTVIDLSTVGPEAARDADRLARGAGLNYIDAPVSGGRAGAVAGTVTVMWAGSKDLRDSHIDVLNAFAANPFHVGDTPGQGQALKILNNFLSATAMAATSEAVLYGLSQGLDMATLLDVVNVSTGQNTASRDKFPQRVLTGTFDAGFTTALLSKDVKLYLRNAEAAGTPITMGRTVTDIWRACDAALPGSDFSRVYEFIRDGENG